jgi:uncharacterized protein YndB with AHSA1/START domain
MSGKQYDWSQFTRKIYIKAPINEVFNAWVKPGNIVKWFIKEAIYSSHDNIRDDMDTVQPGDQYTWNWHQDLTSKGEVLKVIKNKVFQFTFGAKEPRSSERT